MHRSSQATTTWPRVAPRSAATCDTASSTSDCGNGKLPARTRRKRTAASQASVIEMLTSIQAIVAAEDPAAAAAELRTTLKEVWP